MARLYSVPGISCENCRSAIEHEVAKVAGVDRVFVDIDAKTVRVEGAAADAAIKSAIDDAGYDVEGTPTA